MLSHTKDYLKKFDKVGRNLESHTYQMDSSYYFTNINDDSLLDNFNKKLSEYAKSTQKLIYFLNKPLVEEDSSEDYSKFGLGLILRPDHKLIFVKSNDILNDDFEDFCDAFIDDIGFLIKKYRHLEFIGRAKKWRQELVDVKVINDSTNIEGLFTDSLLVNYEFKRNANLLISLIIGSINDIDMISLEQPKDLLEAIKKKIVLFDGDQTRSIHQKIDKKLVRIQGLSGTGKTELLLHKLKEIYTDEKKDKPKILFTCHNKILAESLRDRIPKFFDFMRVEQQILWNERLWCVHAWGSRGDKNSGTLRYICDFYNIPFETYSRYTTFDDVCKRAINEINIKEDYSKAFEYIIIDESQDFPESFFQLCEMVTERKIFVAGDIFQSIFDNPEKDFVEADFLLNKCYRTDPKTLMFSHALGMNLFENEKQLRWLEKTQWEKCGYHVHDLGSSYKLNREPVRRFEDIDDSKLGVRLLNQKQPNSFDSKNIIDIISELKSRYTTLSPDDIAIIIVVDKNNSNNLYDIAKTLEIMIPENFDGWECNIGYESKQRIPNKVFITNTNNIKGLEFPFVICISNQISNSYFLRNSLYMSLTRSFLESFLITFDENDNRIENLRHGLEHINTYNEILCTVPSVDRQKQIKLHLENNFKEMSNEEFLHELINSSDLITDVLSQIESNLKFKISKNPNISKDDLRETFNILAKTLK